MSKLWITADLHLGHRAICKYRKEFDSMEEHNEILYWNLRTTVNKRDTLYLLGDIAFSREWLEKIGEIECAHKKLILGNHDLMGGMTIRDLGNTYDSVEALFKHRGVWFSHCPMHPSELYHKQNIHGHVHGGNVPDHRYLNANVEQWDYYPVSFENLVGGQKGAKVE